MKKPLTSTAYPLTVAPFFLFWEKRRRKEITLKCKSKQKGRNNNIVSGFEMKKINEKSNQTHREREHELSFCIIIRSVAELTQHSALCKKKRVEILIFKTLIYKWEEEMVELGLVVFIAIEQISEKNEKNGKRRNKYKPARENAVLTSTTREVGETLTEPHSRQNMDKKRSKIKTSFFEFFF